MKRLTLITTLLAFCVVVLGAYVRLSDAGLGCPDWPGCYGHLIVPQQNQISQGQLPFTPEKAWKEMIHRYLAGTLTLLILLMALLSRKKIIPWLIVATVIFQAILGMLTVTLRLNPWIVLSHLLGGMTTLGLLWWMYLNQNLPPLAPPYKGGEIPPLCKGRLGGVDPALNKIGLFILIIQIALGGLVSSHNAFLACPDFPTCLGSWWPAGNLSNPAVIHSIHRMGALITFLYLGMLSLKGMKKEETRYVSMLLLFLLLLQIGLGIANVLLLHPLPIAVAHNAVAALLLLTLLKMIKWRNS